MVGGGGTDAASSSSSTTTKNKAGAMRWRAPECLSGRSPTFASDVFSLGMSVAEAVTHDVPWGYLLDDDTVRSLVISGTLPEKPARMSGRMWELVERMCSLRAEERPLLDTVVSELGAMSAADVGAAAVAGTGLGFSVGAAGGSAAAFDVVIREATTTTSAIDVSRSSSDSNASTASLMSMKSSSVACNEPIGAISKTSLTPIPSSEYDRLCTACISGDARWVRDILTQYPDAVRADHPADKGEPPLVCASRNGHIEIVELLLQYGADMNAADTDDWTALHWFAINGRTEMVSELLRQGAQVDSKSNSGATPLYIAAQQGHFGVVVELIKSGANVDFKLDSGVTPVYIAAQGGYCDVVAELLKSGASVDSKNSDGATALLVAALNGHRDMVAELIKSGAQMESKVSGGLTPLHAAATNGHCDVVVELIKNGAQVNSKLDIGVTSLHIAAQYGHRDVVAELVRSGADVTVATDGGLTAMDLAAKNGHSDVVKWLKERAEWLKGYSKEKADFVAKFANTQKTLDAVQLATHIGLPTPNASAATAKDSVTPLPSAPEAAYSSVTAAEKKSPKKKTWWNKLLK
ncbi:hypothetical protein PybrP1_005468 [[Pythium] brassicae (nom. inval.)]|nr:hypothetical protein PybrP1_005468 [[Pythium] brassicae (nom. inval.)]